MQAQALYNPDGGRGPKPNKTQRTKQYKGATGNSPQDDAEGLGRGVDDPRAARVGYGEAGRTSRNSTEDLIYPPDGQCASLWRTWSQNGLGR